MEVIAPIPEKIDMTSAACVVVSTGSALRVYPVAGRKGRLAVRLRTFVLLVAMSIAMSSCKRTESASSAPKVNPSDAPIASIQTAPGAMAKDDALALAFAKQLTLTDLEPDQSPFSWTTERLLDRNGKRYLVHLVARGRSRKLEASHSEDGKASQIGSKSYLAALELTADGAFTHHPEAGLLLVDDPPSPSQLDYSRAASGWPGHDMQRYGAKYENGEKPGVQPEPLSFLAAHPSSAQPNETGNLNSALHDIQQASRPLVPFSRRPLTSLLGENITLVATNVATGKTTSVELSKTGWMHVDPWEEQLSKFSSPDFECVGFEKQLMGYQEQRLICNATRNYTATTMLHDKDSRTPVALHEGDLFYAEGRPDIGYRYFSIK